MNATEAALDRAAALIREADALLITAGAGMGVDSGLPDFRGPEGFWRAYPALRAAGLHFEQIADPVHFRRDPALAWGFYGHRLALYRATQPHSGFAVLKRRAQARPGGAFVFTSNVDGQFQKAGLTPVCEAHGSIHHLQCVDDCRGEVWSAAGFVPEVDAQQCRLLNEPPRCPHCGALARPNILMFGDGEWQARRAHGQEVQLREWLGLGARTVVVELGAGSAIPTVRRFTERCGLPYVRINPREPQAGPLGVSLPLGAAEALARLDARLSAAG
jgi:NAD-dependent SIR2 family protein deacetylase